MLEVREDLLLPVPHRRRELVESRRQFPWQLAGPSPVCLLGYLAIGQLSEGVEALLRLIRLSKHWEPRGPTVEQPLFLSGQVVPALQQEEPVMHEPSPLRPAEPTAVLLADRLQRSIGQAQHVELVNNDGGVGRTALTASL